MLAIVPRWCRSQVTPAYQVAFFVWIQTFYSATSKLVLRHRGFTGYSIRGICTFASERSLLVDRWVAVCPEVMVVIRKKNKGVDV